MLVFIIILVAIIFLGLTASKKGEFFKDYCSPKNTATINGIFSVLIFLSHSVQYVDLNGFLDTPYFSLRSFLGQLVVVTYLFYSGYGIMESIKRKGHSYIISMPFNRFFKLWYHFAIVVLMYIGVKMAFSKPLDTLKTIFAFTGATAVGNSNWYVLITFAMYIIVFVSFFVFRKSKVCGLVSVFILTAVFVFAEIKVGYADRYYNTIFCFPAGMLFSLLKPHIDELLMKKDIVWGLAFSGVLGLFLIFSEFRNVSLFHHNLFSILGALLITVAFMKINIRSTILDWFGKHTFSFFILQRIPMMIFDYSGCIKNPYVFIICSFIATVVLAVIFDGATDKLDSLIFKKKKA